MEKAPLYLTGESYSGIYLAFIGKTLVLNGHKSFKGLAVGDPVLNWKKQMKTYGSTLYGMGLINNDERKNINNIMDEAIYYLNKNNCEKAFEKWNSVFNDNNGGGYPGLF